MVREVVKTQAGILFDSATLQRYGMPSDTFHVSDLLQATLIPEGSKEGMMSLGRTVSNSSVNSTHKKDKLDACCPSVDQLKMRRFWWLLELWPLPHSYQDKEGVWRRRWR